MERQRKERLVGAAVLIMLAVIFIPMVLDNSVQPESGITGSNIPPQPEGEFASRVIPLTSPGGGVHEAGSGAAAGSASTEASAAAPAAVSEQPEGVAAPPAAPVSTPPAPDPAPAVPATTPESNAATTAKPPAMGVTAWVVQLGSFSSAENAESLNKKLRQAGYSAFVEPVQQGATKVFRVRVGPELRRSSAQTVRDRLQNNMELDGIVVPYP